MQQSTKTHILGKIPHYCCIQKLMMDYRHHIKRIYIPQRRGFAGCGQGFGGIESYHNNWSKGLSKYIEIERRSYILFQGFFQNPCVSKKNKNRHINNLHIFPPPPFLLPYLIQDSGLPLPLPHLHIFTFSTTPFSLLSAFSLWSLNSLLIIPASGHVLPVSNDRFRDLNTGFNPPAPCFFSLLWHHGEYVSLPLDV